MLVLWQPVALVYQQFVGLRQNVLRPDYGLQIFDEFVHVWLVIMIHQAWVSMGSRDEHGVRWFRVSVRV